MKYPIETFEVNNNIITKIDSILEIDENDKREYDEIVEKELEKQGYQYLHGRYYEYSEESKNFIEISKMPIEGYTTCLYSQFDTNRLVLFITFQNGLYHCQEFYIFSNIYEVSVFIKNLASNIKSLL